MLDFPEMNGQTCQNRSNTPLTYVPCPMALTIAKLDTLATLCGDEIFLTTLSHARFLRFPRRNWPFSVSSAVNCPDLAATVTTFSCPLTYAE